MNEAVLTIVLSLLTHAGTIVAEGKELFADAKADGMTAEQKTVEVLGDIVKIITTLMPLISPTAAASK